MPHFVIEHAGAFSDQSEIDGAMTLALDCGGDCGFIAREDIKVRAIEYQDNLCGDGRTTFIHLTIHLLAGRTDQMKESLAISLREAFAERFPQVQSLSFDIVDMNPSAYKKRLI